MRNEISKLHRNLGSTTIYVTHDQVEALTMADRIVIMKAGVVQQVGKPIELYDHPVNKFVAGFIGSPQMNFSMIRRKTIWVIHPPTRRCYMKRWELFFFDSMNIYKLFRFL